MASILRQLVAGPRVPHPETDLDLCYVTDNIIATSGPSLTYPKRAYRTPLDHLVSFLDSHHGEDWAIWEFRAEGTGYPDESVYGRIRHYPWPDHHPPPFRLVPLILASMRNWLHGGELHVEEAQHETGRHRFSVIGGPKDASQALKEGGENKRVIVVHCKAGKGRSGTMSCSYLIAEEGWNAQDALERFTQRRMRPNFGPGVSIPSQLRWVGYVERWTRGGKRYIDRPMEIVEIHVRGLRDHVRLSVDGFADEGKRIQKLHTFSREERHVVEGNAPDGGGLSDLMWDLAGYPTNGSANASADDSDDKEGRKPASGTKAAGGGKAPSQKESRASDGDGPRGDFIEKGAKKLARVASSASTRRTGTRKSNTASSGASTPEERGTGSDSPIPLGEPGGMAVVFKPQIPIRVPGSDVNIAVEHRSRTRKSMGLNVMTGVGHVWFNAFFEGNGPEQDNRPDTSGVFNIDWDSMDGIKGTSRKGSRALEQISVVWRVVGSAPGEVVDEPAVGDPVPQFPPANWKGADDASHDDGHDDGNESDGSMAGVKSSGPKGEQLSGSEQGQNKGDASPAP